VKKRKKIKMNDTPATPLPAVPQQSTPMNLWSKKWLRITTYILIGFMLIGIGSATASSEPIEKTVEVQDNSKIRQLQQEKDSLASELRATREEVRLAEAKSSDESCKIALQASIEMNADLNSLIVDIADAIQAYASTGSSRQMDQVLVTQQEINGRIPALGSKVEACTGVGFDI